MDDLSKEYRCVACHKLLFKGLLIRACVGIKCPKCDKLNIFTDKEFAEADFVVSK